MAKAPKPVDEQKKVDNSAAEDLKKVHNLIKAITKSENEERKELKVFKEREQLHLALKSILGEYLNTFLVIGFDPNGNEVSLGYAGTSMENIALNALAERVFETIVMANQGNVVIRDGDDEF